MPADARRHLAAHGRPDSRPAHSVASRPLAACRGTLTPPYNPPSTSPNSPPIAPNPTTEGGTCFSSRSALCGTMQLPPVNWSSSYARRRARRTCTDRPPTRQIRFCGRAVSPKQTFGCHLGVEGVCVGGGGGAGQFRIEMNCMSLVIHHASIPCAGRVGPPGTAQPAGPAQRPGCRSPAAVHPAHGCAQARGRSREGQGKAVKGHGKSVEGSGRSRKGSERARKVSGRQ